MDGFEVDPDALKASATVAKRQDEHLGRIDSYIASACSDFGAFSGVLNLFQGSYESAVATARDGMSDSRKVAVKVRDAFSDSAQDYLDTDREVYEWFKAKFGDLVAFAPYDPPGSGQDVPGGPHQDAPGARAPGDEDDPFALPAPPWWVDKPVGELPRDDDARLPPWMRPEDAVRDAGKDWWRRHHGDEYDYYRSLGYDDDEALALARADRPDAQTQADTRSYDEMQQRASDAYDRAYTDAINDGATDAEAREAGRDAGNQQFADDSSDRTRRTEVSDAAGTYYDVYNEARDVVSNGQDLVDNVQEIDDNAEDLDRYDDYESGAEDESAQEWAR